MERDEGSVAPWRLFDGSIALTLSMLLAVLLRVWEGAASWPVIGTLHRITQWEDGVIIVATLLLFPTALALYGGFRMYFAAKAAADRRARERAERQREEGMVMGRKGERDRIRKELGDRREPITMEELSRILDGDGGRG